MGRSMNVLRPGNKVPNLGNKVPFLILDRWN